MTYGEERTQDADVFIGGGFMDDNASLGAALRAARERAGLSLREVEAMAKQRGASVSASYLSDLEKGKYEALSVERLLALATIYGDTPERIMREANLVSGETSDFLDLRNFDPQMRAYLQQVARLASGDLFVEIANLDRRVAQNAMVIRLILQALRKIASNDTQTVTLIDGIRDRLNQIERFDDDLGTSDVLGSENV